jgi:hypothetical protein
MALLLAVSNYYKTARVYSIKKNNVELDVDEIHYTCHVLGRLLFLDFCNFVFFCILNLTLMSLTLNLTLTFILTLILISILTLKV